MATRSTKGRAKSRARGAARSAKKSTRKAMTSAKKAAAAAGRSASSRSRGASTSRSRNTVKAPKTVSRKRQPVTAVLNSVAETARESPVDRVARVATEVAQQATHAMAEGVDALKELGSTLVDRVART